MLGGDLRGLCLWADDCRLRLCLCTLRLARSLLLNNWGLWHWYFIFACPFRLCACGLRSGLYIEVVKELGPEILLKQRVLVMTLPAGRLFLTSVLRLIPHEAYDRVILALALPP
jgi:hypothetical protein